MTATERQQQRDESVRQLSNALGVYNELVALRRLSTTLRRRCVFLENVQSLTRAQNSMLIDAVLSGTRPSWADEMSRRGANAISPKPKPSGTEKGRTAAVGEGANEHRALQYQGSGGLDRNSTCKPNDVSLSLQLQHRSMSADSIVDLELDMASAASRRQSGLGDTTSADQQDRKRSGKLQEKWQQVKKVFTAKLDAGAATTGARPKIPPAVEKVPKSEGLRKTTRSASATVTTGAKPEDAPQLQLLTVKQPGQHSRSVSPRTPSTMDGGDSSSCRVQSNTGSSSIGLDIADRTLAGELGNGFSGGFDVNSVLYCTCTPAACLNLQFVCGHTATVLCLLT